MKGWMILLGAILLPLLAAGCTEEGYSQAEVDATVTAMQAATLAYIRAIPTETPTPVPTATPIVNRLDCDEIRGTPYHSEEERVWFLGNCITPTPVPPPPPPPVSSGYEPLSPQELRDILQPLIELRQQRCASCRTQCAGDENPGTCQIICRTVYECGY